MKKHIAFAGFALSGLLFIAGSAEAGCGSRGWSGWSRAPAYQRYYYAPAPSAAAGTGTTYRSYSYDPGTTQPGYQYYAPRRYSAPSPSSNFPGGFPADSKIRGNVMGH